MSNRWEHELQQCLDTDIDFPVAECIKLHSEVPQRTIRRRHAQLRGTLMKRLQKRAALGIQAATVASLNTPEFQAAKGSCALGARLKPNVVPAKLFQCSRLSGRNKKSSKFIYPPTKPTRTWWQNMLFASLGDPRWYAHICCPARCHVKKTCFQKQFLLEHHWNTARTSYWNVAGTSTLQQEQSTRKGKMVTYIVV